MFTGLVLVPELAAQALAPIFIAGVRPLRLVERIFALGLLAVVALVFEFRAVLLGTVGDGGDLGIETRVFGQRSQDFVALPI